MRGTETGERFEFMLLVFGERLIFWLGQSLELVCDLLLFVGDIRLYLS